MKPEHICKTCGKNFIGYGKRKFCSKTCLGYENVKRIKFDWDDLSYEKKVERLRNSFEKKVIKKRGCWDWRGGLGSGGYFQIRFNKRKISAHRASWIIYKGNVEEGLWILHKCDNRRCTNPQHLFLGTPKDNSQDRDKKGKGQQGEKHHKSKLTETSVKAIKDMIELGIPDTKIAEKYNVTNGTIWFIKHNVTWKHIDA